MEPMTMMALAGGASQLLGGLLGGRSARRAAAQQARAAEAAAQAQLQAAREAQELTRDVYRQNVGLIGGATQRAEARQEPYAEAGRMALANLMSGFGGLSPVEMQGKFTEEFTGQDIYQDPSYKFRLEEGLRALRAQQAAGGNRMGSQAMKDITQYAQQAASQEYGSAYDRFMRNREALYNRLAGITSAGQTAATQAGQFGVGGAGTTAELGSRMASDVSRLGTGAQAAASDYLTSAAAARGAGQVGSTQAIVGGLTGGLSQGMQNYLTMQYLNKLPSVK